MKIRIRRTGGLAGFDQREEFVTETLAADKATEANRCVTKLLESRVAEKPVGADMLCYEIEIENGADELKKISLVDDGTQPALGELLRALGM